MFDFPDIPKIVYSRNFLRSSIFNIEFEETISWQLHSEAIQNLFKDEFPIKNNKLSIDVNFTKNSKDELSLKTDTSFFELKSLDNLNVLAFENNVVAILFHGKSYQSFQNFERLFNLINEKLIEKELSKYKIKKFSERKINLIDFATPINNGLSFLKQLINSQLVGNIDYVPNSNFIKQSINSIVFEDDNALLDIKYGYNKINNDIGQIILDMVLFVNVDKSLTYFENFEKINTVLYRAFHWAITDEYKQILNGK